MSKIKTTFLIFLLFCAFFAPRSYAQKEELKNDVLYSQEYFDYLIECALEDDLEQKEELKKQQKAQKQIDTSEIVIDDKQNEEETEVISDDYEPFKLKIEANSIGSYKEAYKKVDSKTIIPISDKLSVTQDMLRYRNKYNSSDYRVSAGVEYAFSKYFTIASGVETNYSDLNQNPTSRRAYFTPNLYITDKLSLNFHNKYNFQTKATNHDLGLTFSPLKSKAVDFKVYASLTKNKNGALSESVNFTTNFYLF